MVGQVRARRTNLSIKVCIFSPQYLKARFRLPQLLDNLKDDGTNPASVSNWLE